MPYSPSELQVLHLLDPPDLLALGRVLPIVRRLLKESSHIWMDAFKSAGLPPPPNDLQKHEYAAFVYNHHCHVRASGIRCHIQLTHSI
jgi:hypothetical protein